MYEFVYFLIKYIHIEKAIANKELHNSDTVITSMLLDWES